ncbi:uncharacterized protein LOC134275178 [Saccostrea cucullata]|uniref:uncharacterized protein LOC134275178 n=1 Tax=Saccostrea cuccullata TaxID=36930 RepID=UPI002ED04B11
MESDPGPVSQTDTSEERLPRCKPPVPKKPSISQKPANLTQSLSASPKKDAKSQKIPPPLPKTPPNSGVRKAECTATVSTAPSTTVHKTNTNHALANGNCISTSIETTLNGSFDDSNSNVDQPYFTNSICELNQNTPSISNEDLTKLSKTQSFSTSPRPRLPRTSSNSSVNQNRSPKASNSNSPNVVRKSKVQGSKSTFYDDEDNAEETHLGQSCFYVTSEDSVNFSSEQSQNQNPDKSASCSGNTHTETLINPKGTVFGMENSSSKSVKKPIKTPPKVPPKVSSKRHGDQKVISSSIDSQPKLENISTPLSNSESPSLCIDSDVKESLTLLSVEVEGDTSTQDINGNFENAKLQPSPRNLSSGHKTPSPRPRPMPKPRKSVTPSPRKRSEATEEEKKSGANDSKELFEKETEGSFQAEADVKESTKCNVEVTVDTNKKDNVEKVKVSTECNVDNNVKDFIEGNVEKVKYFMESNVEKEKNSVDNDTVDQGLLSELREEVNVTVMEASESVVENSQKSVKTECDAKEKTCEEEKPTICDTSDSKEVTRQSFQDNVKQGLDLTSGTPHDNSTCFVQSDEITTQKMLSPIAEDKPITVKDLDSESSKTVLDMEAELPETSSLLDEIEKIVTKRMISLENSPEDISTEKTADVPIRPPRPKKESRRKSSMGEVSSMCFDSNQPSSDFRGSSTSLNDMPPPGGKKVQPPKPKRHKINKNITRSQSDISGIRPQGLEMCNKGISIDISDDEGGKNHPILPPRKAHGRNVGKGRSLTVDFCVPANQHALLREIALADHRRELETSLSPENQKSSHASGNTHSVTNLQNTKRQIRPSRKAPPPPPSASPIPKTNKDSSEDVPNPTPGVSTNKIHQGSFSAPIHSDDDSSNVDSHEYHYIPEDLINPPSDSTLHKEKSPSPPDLPPRTYNTSFSTSTSVLSSDSDRPVSVVSVFSSQSESGSFGHGSPGNDELSTDDSECENEEDKIARKWARKIFHIVKEICSSEEVFVDVLRLLNVDFRVFISQATEANGKPVIPNEILNKVLNYLPQLQNLNEELLKDLQERLNKWDELPQVADIFVKKGPFLKLYTSYIKDFSEANEILDEACKRHPSFLTAVKQFERSPRCASLALKHYMLKPIQRIPQYRLLLQDYRKHLTPDSPDYNNTLAALEIVSNVADHANESMRQGDHVQKMLEIQKSVEGNYEVIKPGRTFLKEGELMKLSRKEMQPRMFFLFNDVLLYTSPIATGGYRFNNALTLVGMKVSKPKRDDLKTEFNIISIQRSFMVVAKNQVERDSWVDTLQKAIDDQAQRRNTFENGRTGGQSFYDIYDVNYELGSKAPIWIPDTRVTMCMICTSEFSVTWRRHHCRACGRVVCSNCSDNKAPLEYLRNKPVRVCDECFEKLREALDEKEKVHGIDEKFTQAQDGSFLNLGNLKERFRQIRRSARFTHQPATKRPSRLQIHANDPEATISGYLFKWHKEKKWKKYWFLMKDNVLYTFRASEDVNATDSVSIVGYDIGHYEKKHKSLKFTIYDTSHEGLKPPHNPPLKHTYGQSPILIHHLAGGPDFTLRLDKNVLGP